jgi:hypothetical protein
MIKRIFTILLFFLATCSLQCQIVTEVPKLPSYIPTSNFGTEFYLSTMPYYFNGWGMPYWYVFLSSEVETDVQIINAYGNQKYKIKLLPNKVTSIRLYSWEIEPYYPFNSKESEEKVYINAAMHILSKDPISVFFRTDVGYTSDVYSVLPISNWGKEYIVNTYYSHNWSMTFDPPNNLASSTLIVSGFDSTIVEFTMVGNSNSKTLSGIEYGKNQTFLMNKGDVLPIATSMKQNSTVAGSRIVANKPIGVISGVQCADVPLDVASCDNILEMELPTNTWGKTFHITKHKNRNIGCLFQVVAKEPNTTLYINDQILKVLEKNDTTQLVEWAEFNRLGNEFSDNNFVLTTDKPISVTVFNQGSQLDSSIFKPFQLVLTPIEQYRNEIIGMSFNNEYGGYSKNFLNVIYPLDSNLVMPIDLLWGESNGDTMIWVPFKEKWGDSADYIFEGFQEEKKYASKFLTFKNETIYQIRSKEKIAAYSYGYHYSAYGVPAFLGLKDLTVQDSLPPKFEFVQTADGSIVGVNPNEKALITDLHHPSDSSSKLSMVYCQFSQSVNYDVQIERFIPGDDATTSFTASVIDKSKDAQCVITAIDRAGNDTTILITQKATISSVKEAESTKFLKVTPSITNNEPITIEISNAGDNLSIVSIDGRTIHTFENVQQLNGTHIIHFETASLQIGMYYVLYTVNGKQYQQSFVKMK